MNQTEQPLSPNVFYILLALSQGELHGYAIMQQTRELSDGAVRLGPATLYTTIQRLLDSGLIEEVDGPDDADSRRRYYRLSSTGGTAVRQELDRMEAALKKARMMRLRTSEPRS